MERQASKTILGTLIMEIPLPRHLGTMTTEQIRQCWEKSAEQFGWIEIENEDGTKKKELGKHASRFNSMECLIMEHIEPENGVSTYGKQKSSIEMFYVCRSWTHQDFILAHSPSAHYAGADNLLTKFAPHQVIRYLYLKRRDVPHNPSITGQEEMNYRTTVDRCKTIAEEMLSAILTLFPPPPAPPTLY